MKRLIATDNFIKVNLKNIDELLTLYEFPPEMIRKYIQNMSLVELCTNQTISEDISDLIINFKGCDELYNLVRYKRFNTMQLRSFKKFIDWKYINKFYDLTQDEVIEFKDVLDMDILIDRNVSGLHDQKVRAIIDSNLNWFKATRIFELTKNEIATHMDKVDWGHISCQYKLCKSHIEKFINHLNLNEVIRNNKLDDNIIRKYIDRIDLCTLIQHQQLSDAILIEFQDIIDWDVAIQYQHITRKVKSVCKDKIPMDKYYQIQYVQPDPLVSEFFDEYIDCGGSYGKKT